MDSHRVERDCDCYHSLCGRAPFLKPFKSLKHRCMIECIRSLINLSQNDLETEVIDFPIESMEYHRSIIIVFGA